MAVDYNGAKLLLWAKNLGVSFEKTLSLGHQGVCFSPRQFRKALRDFGIPSQEREMARCFERAPMGPLYADELFKFLGAKEAVALDYSDFEGATLLHDLNKPLPPEHRNYYSFVFDGGTLEHIFDFPSALRHALEALRVGGHFLCISPASNLMGHGFYQISPELLFRVFSEENGFALCRMVLFDASKIDATFYQVNDPARTGHRSELHSAKPMFLAALAQRIAFKPILAKPPQQSDYLAGWLEHGRPEGKIERSTSGLVAQLRTRLNLYWPYWLRRWKQNLIYSRQHGRPTLRNRNHFRKLSAKEMGRERTSQGPVPPEYGAGA